MKVVVGGDHAGYELKQKVLAYLEEQGHEVIHVGSYTPEMVDFPDIAAKVCRSILDGEAERGIMVCGTGVGAAIACNKYPVPPNMPEPFVLIHILHDLHRQLLS